VNDLAALLLHRGERDEWAVRNQARLLGELAPRAGEQIAGFHEALRDGPDAFVLLRPQRAARMREQDFQAVVVAIGEDSGAHLAPARHGYQRPGIESVRPG